LRILKLYLKSKRVFALVLHTKSRPFHKARTRQTLTQVRRFAVCFSLLCQLFSWFLVA